MSLKWSWHTQVQWAIKAQSRVFVHKEKAWCQVINMVDETVFYKRGLLRKCRRVQCLLILIAVFYQVKCALFYVENFAEIFPIHMEGSWEKG